MQYVGRYSGVLAWLAVHHSPFKLISNIAFSGRCFAVEKRLELNCGERKSSYLELSTHDLDLENLQRCKQVEVNIISKD